MQNHSYMQRFYFIQSEVATKCYQITRFLKKVIPEYNIGAASKPCDYIRHAVEDLNLKFNHMLDTPKMAFASSVLDCLINDTKKPEFLLLISMQPIPLVFIKSIVHDTKQKLDQRKKCKLTTSMFISSFCKPEPISQLLYPNLRFLFLSSSNSVL